MDFSVKYCDGDGSGDDIRYNIRGLLFFTGPDGEDDDRLRFLSSHHEQEEANN